MRPSGWQQVRWRMEGRRAGGPRHAHRARWLHLHRTVQPRQESRHIFFLVCLYLICDFVGLHKEYARLFFVESLLLLSSFFFFVTCICCTVCIRCLSDSLRPGRGKYHSKTDNYTYEGEFQDVRTSCVCSRLHLLTAFEGASSRKGRRAVRRRLLA